MSASESVDGIQRSVDEMIASDRVSLAPFPATLRRLEEVLAREHHRQSDLIGVIRTDEVLVATVLRYANSSIVRGTREVGSLAEAIARIGVDELRSLAISAALGAPLKQHGPLQDLRHEVWRTGVFSAELARRLAVRRSLSSHQAFLGGLLWSFGRIVAISCIEHLLAQAKEVEPRPMVEWIALVERSDAPMTALICERWNLPTFVREVLSARGGHDHVRDPVVASMVSLLSAARTVAALADKEVTVSAEVLATVVGLDPSEIAWIADQLPSIPPLVWSMAPVEPTGETRPSALLCAPRPSTQEMSVVDIPVVQRRVGGDFKSTCVGVCEHGFVVEGKVSPQRNQIARFELHTLQGPLDLFGNVFHVERHATGSRAEIKLVALSGTLKRQWDALVTAARNDARAPLDREDVRRYRVPEHPKATEPIACPPTRARANPAPVLLSQAEPTWSIAGMIPSVFWLSYFLFVLTIGFLLLRSACLFLVR